MNLAEYDALSFDCYGTLVDWETGIASVLAAWAREAGVDLTDEELLLAYADNEDGRRAGESHRAVSGRPR